MEDTKFRQLCFDENMNIYMESNPVVREMLPEEVEEYESLVEDSDQLSIFDFL